MVELRVCARPGNGADVDKMIDRNLLQESQKLAHRSRRTPDGKYCSHQPVQPPLIFWRATRRRQPHTRQPITCLIGELSPIVMELRNDGSQPNRLTRPTEPTPQLVP